MPIPMIAGLGPEEIVLIIVVILLLFGATKLPELARGSGRALRIFKAETKGLMDDDEGDEKKQELGGSSAQAGESGSAGETRIDAHEDDEHRSRPAD